MAGFWEKPFSLARNDVSPPMELQKMIFPWIEDYFGAGNEEWVAAYEKEMAEVDENEDEDENVINREIDEEADEEPTQFVEENGIINMREKKGKGKQKASQSSINTAKRGFLRLLIRCRRIILQDAAVYLFLNKEKKYIYTKSYPFASEIFKKFQEDVVAAVASPSVGRLEEYESLVPSIVDTSKEVSSRITEVNHRIVRLQQQQDSQFERLQQQTVNY